MAFDVGNILNASLRNQLLAIKATARGVDVASLRLASGLRVNSAIDNPQSFFAARALQYRSSDLNRLLDGIGQNIQVIKTADAGVQAALRILDQAEAYAADVETRMMNGEIDLTTVPGGYDAPNVTQVAIASPAELISYSGAQDGGGPATLTGDNGFILDGNLWKRRAVNYTITSETVLEFDFRSTVRPEIAAIGFDNDNNYANNGNFFFMYGDQTTGITYAAPTATFEYDASGDWVHVEIPVGTYFTGTFSHMTFVNDDDGGGVDGNSAYDNIILREGPIPDQITAPEQLEAEYSRILDQLDLVVEDAGYRGVNLLDADDMTTFFNEHRTSRLLSEGISASAAGLGLEREDFTSLEAVRDKLSQIREARENLRAYASSLAGDLAVITTREGFTQDMINTLDTGRDMLVLADQNEEGAKILALQTRQQIQMSVLSFRQTTVLELF